MLFRSVIVNHQVIDNELQLRDLRAIYSMKKRFWQSGQPITVYVLEKDKALHRDFSKKRLNVFPNQLESIWYRQVYTGTGSAPITVNSAKEMEYSVANTPGAIGYLYHEHLKKINNNENIKTIKIN